MKRLFSTLIVLVVWLSFNNNSCLSGQTKMLAYGPPLVDPVDIAISPDGTTLFISDFWPDDTIFRLPVTGGTPAVIASGDSFGRSIQGITISPDGSTLFVTETGATGAGPGVIWSLPTTGGMSTILASGGPLVNPHGIATSLDGSTLFIADNWFYAPGIYSLPATGGDPTLLAAVPPYTNYGRALDICVSPDGSTLFVAGGFCIYSLPSIGGALSVIPCTTPLGYATSIALSADGQTLFILDSGGIASIGPTLIYSLPISGGTPTLVLSGPPLAAGGVMRLSRDSTKLYVADIGFLDYDGTGPVGEPGRVFSLSLAKQVAIDIKPGSCPNPLNVKDKGVLSVAILGTEDFDVGTIDIGSIRLADVAPVRSSYEDVATPMPDGADWCECTAEGPDGYFDLVLKFNVQDIVATLEQVNNGDELELTLTGALNEDFGETPIEGTDCIVVISKDGK